MPSEIIIRINSIPDSGDSVFIADDPVLNNGQDRVSESFFAADTGASRVAIKTTIPENSFALQQGFSQDYNQFSDFSFEFPDDFSLKITNSKKENYFDNASVNSPNGNISITSVINTAPNIPLTIDDFNYSESSNNPCGNIDLNITTSKQVTLARYANQDFNPTTNPFTLNISRAFTPRITLFSGNEEISEVFYPPVQYFIERVEQRYTPNGYNIDVIIRAAGFTSVNIFNVLEYSINNVDWQLSSSFGQLTPGDYTFYTRDPYGCEQQVDYTIIDNQSSTESIQPLFELSDLNSFIFADQDESEYSNYYNTLSYQEKEIPSIINNKNFFHYIKKDDSAPIQFRGALYDFECKIINLDTEIEIDVDIDKMSNNINIFDSRDGFLKIFDDNCVGVYLNGGNNYDPSTLDVLGQNNFFKTLPSFYKINEFIKLGNEIGWHQIVEIIFDEETGAFVAKTNYRANTVSLSPVIVTVNYNQLDYEIYEFSIDFSNLEGCYQIELTRTLGEEIIVSCSERLQIYESFEYMHEIRYSNSDNNEINYNTLSNISHLLRIPKFDRSDASPSTDVERNRTDTTTTNIRGVVTKAKIFRFNLIPESMVNKLVMGLSLDNVFINSKGYVLSDFESEPIGNTNLYDVTVTMIYNNKQFTTDSNLRVISNIQEGGYIATQEGNGFIKHNN